MPTGRWDKRGIGVPRVAAQNQYIIDTEELQVDQGILSFFTRKTATNQVRHGIHLVAVHDGSTNRHCSGAFAVRYLLEQAAIVLFIDIIFSMISYVNKRRLKLHQRVYCVVNTLYALPFYRG